MKYLIAALALIFCVRSYAQNKPEERIIKSGKIFTATDYCYYENDSRGNTIYSNNNGMNGPVTMISAADYDSLRRKTRSYLAHSNVGFWVSDAVYDTNKVMWYDYVSDAKSIKNCNREMLNRVNSREEFLQLEAINDLLHGSKKLSSINILDPAGNVVEEISISEEGDTSINTHVYNKNNKEILFRYGVTDTGTWHWDIYSTYDSNLNLIRSARVESPGDTTEVRNYSYDKNNHLISEKYYYGRKFSNRTDYSYDTKGKLTEERFYESDEQKVDVIINYEYDENRNTATEIALDFRKPKKERRKVTTYTQVYW
jgi:YD repeat-containing protein